MDVGKAFSFVFEDKDWVSKILIGGLMLFACVTVVLAPFVAGYIVKLMSKAANGEKQPLPAWENWGELYKTGLVVVAISILYGLIFGVTVSIMKNLPVLKSLVWALQLVFSFYLPVAVLFYAVSGKFEEAFAFEKIFKFITDNIVNLVVIWLLNFILIPISLAGLIILFIGVIFTAFYSLLVRSYLYGDLYRASKK